MPFKSNRRHALTALSESECLRNDPLLHQDHKQKMLAGQIQSLLRSSPQAVVACVLVPASLVFLYWEELRQLILLSWLVLIFVSGLIALALFFAYRRTEQHAPGWARQWRIRLIAGAAIFGSLWGISWFWLLVPGSWVDHLVLVLTVGMLVTGSTAFLAAYLPALYAFLLAFITPPVIKLLLHGEVAISMVALLLVAVAMMVGRHFNRALVHSLEVDLENKELMYRLSFQKEEAERAKANAERADMAKSRFLAAASHDLRQPIHALGLFAAILRGQINEPAARKMLERIDASIEATDNLFNALLDISKLDAGALVPDVQDFPLKQLFEKIEADHAQEALFKGIRLRVAPTTSIARSDPQLLERIIRNLVSNAIRYTPSGGVVVGCRRRGKYLRIEVWDSGIGIPESRQEEIFQEFFQLDNLERDRKKGLGLGLAIVKRLCELLNHPIHVVSQPGRGSKFAIEVPIGLASAETQARPVVSHVSGPAVTGAFILVIDDEVDVLDGMDALLRSWGCHVLTATSGNEALKKMADHERPLDIIISDYRLRHGETGIGVMQRLQAEIGEKIPGILITGDVAADRLQEADESRYRLLHKPVPPALLRTALYSAFLEADRVYEEPLGATSVPAPHVLE